MSKDFILQELMMSFKSRIRYKIGIVSDLIVMTGTYFAVYLFQTGSPFEAFYDVTKKEASVLLLIGFLFWQFGVLALGFTTSLVSSDSSTGRLEIKVQSTPSIISIYFIQLIANFATSFLVPLVLVVITVLLGGASINIVRLLLSIMIIIPSIIGMYGIGLIIAGIGLKEKKIKNFILIVQTVLIFVGNTLVPRENALISIIPFSLGIDIARDVYLHNYVSLQSVGIYVLVNLFWLIIGIKVFNKFLNTEKKYGSFDTY